MTWRILKLGKLKLSIGEKRLLHTGKGFRTGCGHNYTGTYISLYWNGIEKLAQIVKLDHDYELLGDRKS